MVLTAGLLGDIGEERAHPVDEARVEVLGVPVRDRRDRHRHLETVVDGREPRRHEPAVRRADHPDPVRVGDPHRDHRVDPREIVVRVAPTHVADDRRCEVPPTPRRPPGVRLQDRVPLGQQEGVLEAEERVGGRPDGATVDVEEQRERPVAVGQGEEAVDLEPVGGSPGDDPPLRERRQPHVVAVMTGLREHRHGPPVDDEQLRRTSGRGPGAGEGITRADGRRARLEGPADRLGGPPKLANGAVGGVDVTGRRFEAVERGNKHPVAAPARRADVAGDPGPADLARVRVDQQQVPGDHIAVAADGLEHGDGAPVRGPLGELDLDVGAVDDPLLPAREVDDRER